MCALPFLFGTYITGRSNCTCNVKYKRTDALSLCKSKNRSTERCSKLKNPETSSGEVGLNIRTLASPKVGQDHVSGGVSIPCRHATPVADILRKPIFGEMSDSVRMLNPVIMSQIGIMSNR